MEETFNIEDLIETNPTTADIGFERKMCINAILNTDYMKGVKQLLNDITLLESPMARTVMTWAIDHFHTYGKCLGTDIIGVYEQKKIKMSETMSKDISDFLESISEEAANGFHMHNVPFALDEAEAYIDRRSVYKLTEKVDKAMLTGNTAKAKQAITQYNQVKMVAGVATNGFEDFSRFGQRKVKDRLLFNLPKPFDELYGPIYRRHLGAVAANAKVGKSRNITWLLCEALRAGQAVFVASLEMEVSEFLELIDKELLRNDLFGGEGYIPCFTGSKENTKIKMNKVKREAKTEIELIQQYGAMQKFNNGARLYVHAWPQHTCSVENDLVPQLDLIKSNDNIDVSFIAIDYADLLADEKEDLRADTRIRIANRWRRLKKLAQEREVFVFTASQLNAATGTLSESMTKAQDSNFIISIHQNADEKKYGIYRQYVMYHRGISYDPSRAMYTLSNNGIGLFNLDGRWEYDGWDIMPDLGDDFKLWKSYEDNSQHEKVIDLYDLI